MPSIITLGSASARAYGFEGLGNQISFKAGSYEDPIDQTQYNGFCYSNYYLTTFGETRPNPPRLYSFGGLIVGAAYNQYDPNYGPFKSFNLTFPSDVSQTFAKKIIVYNGTTNTEYLISAAAYQPFDGSDTYFSWTPASAQLWSITQNILTIIK